MTYKIISCLLLISFFSSCKKDSDPVGPCECETYVFPYLGFHDITKLDYIDNREYRSYDVSYDFSGNIIVEFTDSSSFIIDCDISIDTLNIDFYLDGSYSFDHACSWAQSMLSGHGKFNWCKMMGTGILNIENAVNIDLQNQEINFNYDGGLLGAQIIIPIDKNLNKIKIGI